MKAQRQSDSKRGQDRRPLLRYTGMGFELAASIIGLTLLGLWIDHRFDTRPAGVVIGAGLGTVGGMYNFIRGALRLSKQDHAPNKQDQTHGRDDHHERP